MIAVVPPSRDHGRAHPKGMSRGATTERRGVFDAREVQASLRDAGRGLRWFRGLKHHGYHREVAPRLWGSGFRNGRAGRSAKSFDRYFGAAPRSSMTTFQSLPNRRNFKNSFLQLEDSLSDCICVCTSKMVSSAEGDCWERIR